MSTVAKKVRDSVSSSLQAFGLNCQVRVVNNSVVVDEELLRIYIRVLPLPGNVRVEMSNISFHDESLKRKGIFTHIMSELSKIDDIADLTVTCVLTDEMRNWCLKNRCTLVGTNDYKYK